MCDTLGNQTTPTTNDNHPNSNLNHGTKAFFAYHGAAALFDSMRGSTAGALRQTFERKLNRLTNGSDLTPRQVYFAAYEVMFNGSRKGSLRKTLAHAMLQFHEVARKMEA